MYFLKTAILRILIIALFAVSLFPSPGLAAGKPLVAVMDFENRTPHGGWRVGRGASDMLSTAMVKSKKFRVIERNKLQTLLKEQNFSNSSRVDTSTATRIGKILGVQYIITGAVTEYGQSRSGGGGGVKVGKVGYFSAVDIRMLDATTGEIVFAEMGEGAKSSVNVRVLGFGGGEKFNEKHATASMRNAIDDLLGKIKGADFSTPVVAKSTGPIMVADVDGNTIMLNQGSSSGLETGQTLNISRKDRVIKDPSTGAVLTTKYKSVGKIKLNSVEGTYSTGTIVSGSGFAVGDIIKSE